MCVPQQEAETTNLRQISHYAGAATFRICELSAGSSLKLHQQETPNSVGKGD